MNQPLRAYATSAHAGALGKSFSLLRVDSNQVEVQAIKQAEDGDAIIVRLKEMTGKASPDVTVAASAPIASAYEVDGQERRIGDAKLVEGHLVSSLGAYRLRSFAVKLAPPVAAATPAQSQSVALPFDEDVVTADKNLTDGKFDDAGRTFAAEQFPKKLAIDGVDFRFGPTDDGAKNALASRGQTIPIPAGFDRVYIVAASASGDRDATFKVGDAEAKSRVQDWGGFVGQWDNRQWSAPIEEPSYNETVTMTGLVHGYVKRDPIVWFSSHRHHPATGNEAYEYSYLFKYGFDVPAGATSITLPNDPSIRVFAVSVAKGSHADTKPAAPLSDTLDDRGEPSLPTINVADAEANDSLYVAVNHGLYWDQSKLRYTLDGSEPKLESPAYNGPIFIARNTTLRVRQFASDGKAGPVVEKAIRINDHKAPQLTAATAVSTLPIVSLEFNEPLDPAQATAVANYKLAGGSAVTAASISDDGKTVTLALDKPLATPDASIQVTNLRDRSENANAVSGDAVAVRVSQPVVTIDSFKGPADPVEQRVEGLPVAKNAPWAMNYFVRIDRQLDSRTAIAGFGHAVDGETGKGRYFVKLDNTFRFWSCNRDVASDNATLDVKKWQMLTATYDGKTLRTYKNGELLADREIELADDEPVVRLAPASPWSPGPRQRFGGEIADFTIWNAPLSPAALKQIAASGLEKLNASPK